MKYLTLCIRTEDRTRVLYERDMDARTAAAPFVARWIRDLVREDIIHNGEHYRVILYPRYVAGAHPTPLLMVDAARVAESRGVLELDFEGQPPPDQVVQFFSVELRIVERSIVYRRDFSPQEIIAEFLTHTVNPVLIRMGLLKEGEYYRPAVYARDDDKADFDRERMPELEKRAASLVELVDDPPETPAFATRDPDTAYGPTQLVGEVGPDDIRIYVGRRALNELLADAKVSKKVERGGMLVGQVYEHARGGRKIVEISDLIVSEGTTSNVVELRYTFESWRGHMTRLREKYPGRRIVGWYHTHLIEAGVRTRGGEPMTMFFSRDDLFLHRQFFPEEWYVAMVLDPDGNCCFFQWQGTEIRQCGGYRIFDDTGVVGGEHAGPVGHS
jgi:hypothetical protein